MRVIKTLNPGQNGTQRLRRRFGDKLVKVRYREDLAENSLYTTVELIVDQRAIMPGYVSTTLGKRGRRRVAVKISFDEKALRHRAKVLGAKWNGDHKLWMMSYANAESLGIVDRVLSAENLYQAGVNLDA